jgi:predicted PhzF superfamily epimerase YddE/YHI9
VGVPITVVDAFTSEAFRGNPAAVCRLPSWPSDEWLACVAGEMNLSETAFLVARGSDDHELRWFTPSVEVDLCGHATLASAHVLGGGEPHRFHTRSGLLISTPGADGSIELDFPALTTEPAVCPHGLRSALGGVEIDGVWSSRFDLLVEVVDADAVRALVPDHPVIAALGVRGVIVTAAADTAPLDFVSRFFAPGSGVDEDPVTGSAHCVLAPFWAARLGKTAMQAAQLSSRGGHVAVRVEGDRVVLGGRAVTVWTGELLIEPR